MTTYPHPACMEPDGGEGPCRGYNALDAENAKLRDMLFASSQYIEIYAEMIRHEPWRQQALDLIAAINALPGAKEDLN